MERLRQRADFLAAATGLKVPATAFVLQARRRAGDGPVRVGFTVTKKIGNAVERNRIRRRLREIVRHAGNDAGGPAGDAAQHSAGASGMRAGHDYVLIGRRAALTLPFDRIAQDFAGALRRLHAGRQPTRHGTGPAGKQDGPAAKTGNS